MGKIYFLLVRIKIKHMELSIIRRETTGAPPNQYNESETITKYEIMDGAPVRGETIPIRLFLSGFELTPTFRDGKMTIQCQKEMRTRGGEGGRRTFAQSQTLTLFSPCVCMIVVNMKFSARYYLNLVLVDEENRRYFKQQEITIFRREGKSLLPLHDW